MLLQREGAPAGRPSAPDISKSKEQSLHESIAGVLSWRLPRRGFTGHSMGHYGAGRRSDLPHFGLCRFDGGQQPVYRRRRQCGFAAGGGSPDSGAGGGHRSGYGCGTADGAAAYAAWDSGHPVGNPVAAGSIFHQHAHSGALQPALAQGGDPSDAEKSCNGHYSGGDFRPCNGGVSHLVFHHRQRMCRPGAGVPCGPPEAMAAWRGHRASIRLPPPCSHS